MEALKAEGTQHIFGLPGGASLPIHDALHDADAPRPGASRGGAGHTAEGYAARAAGSASRSSPLAPARRTSSLRSPTPTWTRRRRVVDHRPGPHGAARHRCVPGGRRDRHHAPIVKHAIGSCERPRRSPRRRSTRRSRSRAAAGPGRCSSTCRRTSRSRRSHPSRRAPTPPTCPGSAGPARRTARRSGRPRQRARAGPAAGDLRRRRRRQAGAAAELAELARFAGKPVVTHADGARRVPGGDTAVARDARDARDAPGQLGGRRDAT